MQNAFCTFPIAKVFGDKANESVIKLFEGKQVRIVWDEEQEKYYFSVTDIVQVLTDSVNPRDYIKKMLRRDPELKSKWGTICPPVEMEALDGNLLREDDELMGDVEELHKILISSVKTLKEQDI